MRLSPKFRLWGGGQVRARATVLGERLPVCVSAVVRLPLGLIVGGGGGVGREGGGGVGLQSGC